MIDRTPPTYAFSGFDPFVASPGTPVTIDVIAVDEGSGINSIDVYVNSAADGSTNGEWHLIGSISGQQGNLVWDTTGYAEGIYRVAFDMYDNAGNQGPDPQPILFYEIRENNEEVLDNSVFLPLVVKEN